MGNNNFKSPTNQTPRHAQTGEEGLESWKVRFEQLSGGLEEKDRLRKQMEWDQPALLQAV